MTDLVNYIDADRQQWSCELCGAVLWPNILESTWIYDSNRNCPAVTIRYGMAEYNRKLARVETVFQFAEPFTVGEMK